MEEDDPVDIELKNVFPILTINLCDVYFSPIVFCNNKCSSYFLSNSTSFFFSFQKWRKGKRGEGRGEWEKGQRQENQFWKI